MQRYMTAMASRNVIRRVFGKRLYVSTVYRPPSLVDLPQRWTSIKNQELKDEIKEYLEWKMEEPWTHISPDEARSAYYISYGNWGPRGTGKDAQPKDINIAYFIFRILFNITLLGAVGITYLNWKHDKKHIEMLKQAS